MVVQKKFRSKKWVQNRVLVINYLIKINLKLVLVRCEPCDQSPKIQTNDQIVLGYSVHFYQCIA